MEFLSFAALPGEPPAGHRRVRFGARPASARPARPRGRRKNAHGPRAVPRRSRSLYRSEDGLGSVVATNDPAGAVSHSVVFDAWGNTKSELGTRSHPFTYTGREVGEAGQLFYRARFYQPGIGRFGSEDPTYENIPSRWAAYVYVGNSPVSYVDPKGLVRNNLNLTPVYKRVSKDDLTRFTGKSGVVGVTYFDKGFVQCNCRCSGYMWRPSISFDGQMTVLIAYDAFWNGKHIPESLIRREENKHVSAKQSVFDDYLALAKEMEQHEYPIKSLCGIECWLFELKFTNSITGKEETWTHLTDPHPY